MFVLLFNASGVVSSVDPTVENWKATDTVLKVSTLSDVVGQHESGGNKTAIETVLVGKGMMDNGSY